MTESQWANKLRLRRLCTNCANPCYLVTFRDVTLLLDCPLDLSTLAYFMPKHPLSIQGASSNIEKPSKQTVLSEDIIKIDDRGYFDSNFEVGLLNLADMNTVVWDSVDVILISNFKTILGLPFITERTNFRGKIFATDPTVEFGRIMINDILDSLKTLPKQKHRLSSDTKSKDWPIPLIFIQSFDNWHEFYSKSEMESALTKIERVAYNQPKNLFGLLNVHAVSAGYAIGSSNWIFGTEFEKISYISQSSIVYSHTMSLDHRAFKGCDVLIVGSISHYASTDLEKTVADFCNYVLKTLKDGGNVLVPCNVCGFVLDLLEALEIALVSHKMERYPIYLMCPQARSTLAYANIYAEWLNQQKEALVYRADAPFVFNQLSKNDHLLPIPSVDDSTVSKMRSPCVVFASHPSLRFGPAVHLLKTWSNSDKNALILVDHMDYVPTYNVVGPSGIIESRLDEEQLLAPFQPLSLKVFQCNMDPRVAPSQMGQLVADILPKRAAVIPFEYAHMPILLDPSVSLFDAYTISMGTPLDLSFPGRPERVKIDASLAACIHPTRVSDGCYLTLLEANLVTRDGQHLLQPKSANKNATILRQSPSLVGRMEPSRVLEEMHKRGLTEARLEALNEDRHIIFFPNSNTLIQLEPESTHIICDEETTRVKVRDSLVACLSQIPT